MIEPETIQARSPRGRFAAGHSGNPRGRPLGSRHKVTLAVEKMMEGEAEGITRKAIEMAMDGDITALRLCLERIAPPCRERPISFALPPIVTVEDAEKASAALLVSVAAGDLTARQAGPVMSLLVAHKGLVESGDQERRIAALEARVRR